MKTIRARLRVDDSGLSLIEVIVAMMVFAIVAVGVAYTLTNILTLTKDARSKEVASNLASEALDAARSLENVFSVTSYSQETPIDGITYTLDFHSEWETGTDAGAQCGAADSTVGGSLQYKSVNIEVEWEGMRSGAKPVRLDTLLAPNDRINTPGLGTILVSVLNANNVGNEGIVVSAVPTVVSPNTARAITETILPTDREGCSYILKVVPGTYTVSISRVGSVDSLQGLSPSSTIISVKAGETSSAGFSFDAAARYSLRYASNAATTPLMPSNIEATYVNTNNSPVIAGSTASLFPFTDGYTVVAGRYIKAVETNLGCLSPNPVEWQTPAADGAIGVGEPVVTLLPGGSSPVNVPMGVLTVSGSAIGKFLTAVPQFTSPTGDPGCATQRIYTFPKITTATSTVALPYGTWALYVGASSGQQSSQLGASSIAPLTRNIKTGDLVTLDPRTVPAP